MSQDRKEWKAFPVAYILIGVKANDFDDLKKLRHGPKSNTVLWEQWEILVIIYIIRSIKNKENGKQLDLYSSPIQPTSNITQVSFWRAWTINYHIYRKAK